MPAGVRETIAEWTRVASTHSSAIFNESNLNAHSSNMLSHFSTMCKLSRLNPNDLVTRLETFEPLHMHEAGKDIDVLILQRCEINSAGVQYCSEIQARNMDLPEMQSCE